jgi:putative isomerase
MPKFEHYETLLRDYISKNVGTILKEPNSYLRYPFVDPGSVYNGNLWDWDSFWAVFALLNLIDGTDDSKAAVDRKDLYVDHAKGNIHNFFDHQLEDGYIPMLIAKSKHNPEPYLNMKHKEGHIMNMHKPFLCQQIALISEFCDDFSWAERYFVQMESYFDCYNKYYYNQNCGLYVWADDIMIGMDNDPATFGRPKFSTANMFLNGFMVAEFKAMALISQKFERKDREAYYLNNAQVLTDQIQEECWDLRDKFFYSVDVDIKTRQFDWFHKGLGVFWKTLPIKIRAWTGFIPLWAGAANQQHAAYLVGNHIEDKNTFNSPYGITSLAKDEKMFNITATNNPSNWLGPIWIVVNYVVFRGLMNYGYRKEAEEICRKTVFLLGQDLEQTGTLHEYYDPDTGAPVMNGGFLNWNLLVINMIDELNGKSPMCRFLA